MRTLVKSIMIKYLLAVLLVSALCMLVACGGERDSDSDTDKLPNGSETADTSIDTEETEESGEDTNLALPRDEF